MSRLYMRSGVLLGTGVLFFTLSAGAQTWRQDSFGQPRYDPYYRNGQSQDYLLGRVMSDLNQAASRAYLDGHERNHFDEVARNLQDFQARWSRGHFDTGKLDNAIHNLEHLAQADRVHPSDREMLARDLYDLRQFRATRGSSYQSPGYYRNWR